MKPRHSSNEDSDQIMANIAETRAHMDDTLDELSARLQPRHILDDVLDWFRSRRSSGSGEGRQRIRQAAGNAAGKMKEKASRAAGQMKDKASTAGRAAYSSVREHPLPALLIGAGISLLLRERKRRDEYESYEDESDLTGTLDTGYAELPLGEGVGPETYALPEHYSESSSSPGFMGKIKGKGSQLGSQLKEKGAQLKEKAGSSMQNIKQRTAEKASALRMRASEKGSQLKEQAYHGYEHGREVFTRTADEQPLAVGLGFLAIGVLAGMLLPSTRKEDELVGSTRDRLVNRTREAAEDAVNRGKHVARTAVDVAKQEMREQGLTPDALKEKAQTMKSKVAEATRDDAQRQKQEFTDQVKQS